MKSHVTIVLDVSGSMAGHRLDTAKREMKALVNTAMKPGDSISIVTFHDDVATVVPPPSLLKEGNRLTKWAPNPSQTKRPAQFSNGGLDSTIDGIQTRGTTALYDAFRRSFDGLKAAVEQDLQAKQAKGKAEKQKLSRTYQLFVLTDGEDNASTGTNADQVRAMLEHPGGWAAKCHFHTTFVAIGEEGKRALAPIFKQPLEAGLKHAKLEYDITEGFRRVSEVVTTVKEVIEVQVVSTKKVESSSTKQDTIVSTGGKSSRSPSPKPRSSSSSPKPQSGKASSPKKP